MGIRDTVRALAAAPTRIRAATDLAPLSAASPWAIWPNHLAEVGLPEWLGDLDMPLTKTEALRVPAVARARRLLCGTIGRLPMRVYDAEGDPIASQPRWLDRSDGTLSAFKRTALVTEDLMFHGWALLDVVRDAPGAGSAYGPVQRLEYHPFGRWEFDPDGRILVCAADDPADASPSYLAAPGTVALIPGPDEGLLAYGSTAIRHAAELGRIAERAARTPVPQIELHDVSDVPLPEAERKKLVAQWAAARQGDNGGVAYTNKSVEVKAYGQQNADMVIEARNAAVVDIARAVGIPASMLDATAAQAALTYETSQGRNAEFIDYGLAPHMAAICARLGMDDITPPGQHVEFELDGFTSLRPPNAAAPDDGANPTPPTPTPTTPRSENL